MEYFWKTVVTIMLCVVCFNCYNVTHSFVLSLVTFLVLLPFVVCILYGINEYNNKEEE